MHPTVQNLIVTRRLLASLLVACILFVVTPTARADDDAEQAPQAAPRVALAIEGMSVVLIAANDRLYAFVDREADNAPVEDARLTLTNAATGARLALQQAAPGLFVAPFTHTGRPSDNVLVTLNRFGIAQTHSPVTAQLIYTDTVSTPAQEEGWLSHGWWALWTCGGAALGLAVWAVTYRRWSRGWWAAGKHAA